MKLLFDFLPIALFFAAFKWAEGDKAAAAAFATDYLGLFISGGVVGPDEAPVLLATVVVIAATLAQVLWLKLSGRRVDHMLWVSLGLVCVMGGLTVYFHSETFIKWKPSLLYWAMGLSFWLSPILLGKNIPKLLMGEQIDLPARLWHRLNFTWVAFFGFMGLLNLWVVYHFSTAAWVNFKLFGGIGLMLVFTLAQGLWLAKVGRVIEDSPATAADPEKASGA
jgi:intracellular septation protein